MEITYKHKTNIKLNTAVAIDTNTCYNFGLIFKIMILTDKAKNDFTNWCKNQTDLALGIQIPNAIGGFIFHLNSNPEILPKRILNNLIVDFFDYVNIPIVIYTNWKTDEFGSQIKHYDFCYFKTRNEAIEKAILKANELYNRGFKDIDMEAEL